MFIIFFFLFTVSVFCGILGGLSQSQEQFKKLFIFSFNVSIILFLEQRKAYCGGIQGDSGPYSPPKTPDSPKLFSKAFFSVYFFFKRFTLYWSIAN